MEEIEIKIPESEETVVMSEDERKEILNTIVADIVLEYKKEADGHPSASLLLF